MSETIYVNRVLLAWDCIISICFSLVICFLYLTISQHYTRFLCGNLPLSKVIRREPHAWNLRVKNTWEHAHKFSETACKIVHLDCIHLTTFIFGWNLWSNAQWSLAVELCKCTLNIGHILGKTQTDCFSHLTVSKLLSIRFWKIYSPSSLSLCLQGKL